MIPKPSVGRVVHFHAGESQPHAAIIAKVWGDVCVNLHIIDGNGNAYNRTSVLLSTGSQELGTWSWPERV